MTDTKWDPDPTDDAGEACRFVTFTDDGRELVVQHSESWVWVWEVRRGKVIVASGLGCGGDDAREIAAKAAADGADLEAGTVVLEGVEMFGDTMCPHCLGRPDRPATDDTTDEDTGACSTCRGHGEGVFLNYLER